MNIFRVTYESKNHFDFEGHIGVFSSEEKAYEAISQELVANNDNIITTDHFSGCFGRKIDELHTILGDCYYVYHEQLDIAP